MSKAHNHTFHIPVMGLGYTIDTPLKVARFGISSVISIVEDHLIERMREIHSAYENIEYIPISTKEDDYRARRITAYLNLIHKLVERQSAALREESFESGNDIIRYFELLPEHSPAKQLYMQMQSAPEEHKAVMQKQLRGLIIEGAIDVNIMTKLDNANYDASGTQLPVEYNDAMSALRGFARSELTSSIVFSAGINPRLYTYCESFDDFFPGESGRQRKKIILKVSDYRSALIQGRFLAKKGLWVSEFRVESGLNCGGHAFATDGLLFGPILEEFRVRRAELQEEMFSLCTAALREKGAGEFAGVPHLAITAQGGIGTAIENEFLLEYYGLDSTGWGSPFLLVPEVTNVDDATLQQLATAKKSDYYLSDSSPLGVPFNNFRNTSSDEQRKMRIAKNRPGSACYKKFLTFNTEFTSRPICTASRQYQDLKIKEAQECAEAENITETTFDSITVKDCLCEGLGAAALVKNNAVPAHNLTAVTICPGPNLAYFSGIHSLQAMVQHIYGEKNLLNEIPRPHMFINEIHLYIDYLKKELQKRLDALTTKQTKHFEQFKAGLLEGVQYYRQLIPAMLKEGEESLEKFRRDLAEAEYAIRALVAPLPGVAPALSSAG